MFRFLSKFTTLLDIDFDVLSVRNEVLTDSSCVQIPYQCCDYNTLLNLQLHETTRLYVFVRYVMKTINHRISY